MATDDRRSPFIGSQETHDENKKSKVKLQRLMSALRGKDLSSLDKPPGMPLDPPKLHEYRSLYIQVLR